MSCAKSELGLLDAGVERCPVRFDRRAPGSPARSRGQQRGARAAGQEAVEVVGRQGDSARPTGSWWLSGPGQLATEGGADLAR